ncbi:MAG: hypothetical protein NC241_02555 [Bacteroides sp.]|nr:hypothetical protein [Bacteroides sp.]MCM1457453.1 hypothetical protein [Lachnoclostridium sp.]
MKRFAGILIMAFAVLLPLCGCGNNDVYDEMPQKIQMFVSQYWPNSEMASFTVTATGSVARIEHGPTLTFDSEGEWTAVDGNGATLPPTFLFDRLPQPLYEHLEATENTAAVYAATRRPPIYTVRLSTRTLTYDSSTASLTGD